MKHDNDEATLALLHTSGDFEESLVQSCDSTEKFSIVTWKVPVGDSLLRRREFVSNFFGKSFRRTFLPGNIVREDAPKLSR